MEKVKSKSLMANDPSWLRRSNYYLLEFIIALIGVSVSLFFFDQALFSLMQYFKGEELSGFLANSVFFIASVALVWLPLTIIFYKRSRHEEINRPEVASTKLRRFFLYVFMIIMLFAAAGFSVAALYSVFQMIFGIESFNDLFVQLTLPAIFAAALHAAVFWSFLKKPSQKGIKEFVFGFSSIGLALVILLVLAAGVQARGSLIDEKISEDLSYINDEVQNYYSENRSLPDDLNELSLDSAVKDRAGSYGYVYEKQRARSFGLCAEFKTESKTGSSRPNFSYSSPQFDIHGKGKECFDLKVSGSNYYDILESEPDYNPNIDSLFDYNKAY